MKGNRVVLTVVVVLALIIAGWWIFKRSNRAEPIDLIARFDTTVKLPSPDTFTVTDANLNGETKRAIAVKPGAGTRLKWTLTVPDDGWLVVSVALKPEAWEKPGDGVKFHVGVSDGRAYEEMFSQHVDPSNIPTDRRWIPVRVDLSAYAGEQVELIFNTNSSMPGKGDNQENDLALWGAPEIVIR